ncbi:DUF6221 family protein [Streptomyces capoamus]|uniref:DUF6221 family protein n=1 Tax=Streptomyces capoamus TaxID=68183 RepID=UPI00339753D2
MDELVRWLGEQLDEDERIARAAIEAAGDVPGAANWRFGNAYTDADEEVTYWQITTMTPKVDGFGPVELVGSGMSGGGAHEPEIAQHAVEHDPARVLQEIDAKRRVLARHHAAPIPPGNEWIALYPYCAAHAYEWPEGSVVYPVELKGCPELRDLAAAYSHRPGYREEWRP